MIEYIIFAGFFGFMAFVVWSVFFKNKGFSFKTMKFQELKKTFDDELKDKLDNHGENGSGFELFIGSKKISRIDKYKEIISNEFESEYDQKTKNIITTNEEEESKFMLIRTFSNNIFSRIFGTDKRYYLFNTKLNGKTTFHIDHSGKKIIFPYFMDIVSYGKVWINSTKSADYLQNISIKRMLEQTQMYLENFPDKTIHLENEIARNERLLRTNMDLEKGKYEESKLTGETRIE